MIVSPPLTLPSEIATASNKPGLSSSVRHTEGIPRQLGELLRHAADALLLHNPKVELKQVGDVPRGLENGSKSIKKA